MRLLFLVLTELLFCSLSFAGPLLTQPLLPNSLFSPNGFYGQDAPRLIEQPPRSFTVDDSTNLSINSRPCQELRQKTLHCQNFEEIDVMLALDDRVSLEEVRVLSLIHPWRQNPLFSASVIAPRLSSLSVESIKALLDAELSQCRLIRRFFLASHGVPGAIEISRGDVLLERIKIEEFFKQTKLNCRIAPQALIQFDACEVACRESSNGAPNSNILQGLKQWQTDLLGDSAHAGPSPLAGTRILLNAGKGRVRLDRARRLLVVEDVLDHGVLATFDETSVSFDTHLEEIPACPPVQTAVQAPTRALTRALTRAPAQAAVRSASEY